MFANIGEKIKTLTKAICWIGIIASIIIGIVLMVSDEDFIILGYIILIAGALVSWISSFVLYGFGELISQVTKIANNSFLHNQYLQKNCNTTIEEQETIKNNEKNSINV